MIILVSTALCQLNGSWKSHLKLSLDFDDLHKKLGIPITGDDPEVLGALWVESREVFIDQSLDPDENPAMEGRFRFTVAHEIGHWWLHRGYIQDTPGEMLHRGPTVVCRASHWREPIEWQADTFAAALLMPASLVHYWWREMFSRSGPLIYDAVQVRFRLGTTAHGLARECQSASVRPRPLRSDFGFLLLLQSEQGAGAKARGVNSGNDNFVCRNWACYWWSTPTKSQQQI